jgi:hypothetical protein
MSFEKKSSLRNNTLFYVTLRCLQCVLLAKKNASAAIETFALASARCGFMCFSRLFHQHGSTALKHDGLTVVLLRVMAGHGGSATRYRCICIELQLLVCVS